MARILTSLVLLLALAAPARAAVLHVGPGQNLQTTVNGAAPGDDILVAGGTYAAISIDSKELHLYGGYDTGFSVRSAATPSIVQGTPAAPAVSLYESAGTVVDGFTIRGGQRGVYIEADFLSTTNRPRVANCLIEQNGTATLYGGGVFARHCDAELVGNVVRDNIARRGSGMAIDCNSILIEDNLVEDNVSHEDHGGGLYLTGDDLVVRGNLVRNNEVGVIIGYGWGGGAIAYGAGTHVLFQRNVWTQNHAKSTGSGAFVDDGAEATFDHDLFYDNQCSTQGGVAVYVDGYATDVSSHVQLLNVTIAGHDCPGTLGNAVLVERQSSVVMENCLVWDNGGDDFVIHDTSTISATYTLSQEAIAGTGNLVGDPLFANQAAGDFHVRSTHGRFDPASGNFVTDAVDSPSIDRGDPASPYALEPGPNGLRVNLGNTGNTDEASMGAPGGVPLPDAGVPDAAAPPPIDAGPLNPDAAPPIDAGPFDPDASPLAPDAAPQPGLADAGPLGGGGAPSCDCSIGRRPAAPSLVLAPWLLGLALLCLRRRRR